MVLGTGRYLHYDYDTEWADGLPASEMVPAIVPHFRVKTQTTL